MGLNVSKDPLTPPLEKSQMVNGDEAAQKTFLIFLQYLNYIIIHHDTEKYRGVLGTFSNSPYLYKSTDEMALVLMSKLYRVNATHEALMDIYRFFNPRQNILSEDVTGKKNKVFIFC